MAIPFNSRDPPMEEQNFLGGVGGGGGWWLGVGEKISQGGGKKRENFLRGRGVGDF